MSQPYIEPEKDRIVICTRCCHEHSYSNRKYSHANNDGLRFSSCPECGGLGFRNKDLNKITPGGSHE